MLDGRKKVGNGVGMDDDPSSCLRTPAVLPCIGSRFADV